MTRRLRATTRRRGLRQIAATCDAASMTRLEFAVTEVGFSDADALVRLGLLALVDVGIHPNRETELRRQGQPVPDRKGGKALVDTGSQHTFVHSGALTGLGVPQRPGMLLEITTLSGQAGHVYHPIHYGVSLYFHQHSGSIGPFAVDFVVASDLPSVPRDVVVLLGRDFLQRFTLEYNGAAGSFSLTQHGNAP